MEEERRLEEIRKKIFTANGEEVLRQIHEKIEKAKLKKKYLMLMEKKLENKFRKKKKKKN